MKLNKLFLLVIGALIFGIVGSITSCASSTNGGDDQVRSGKDHQVNLPLYQVEDLVWANPTVLYAAPPEFQRDTSSFLGSIDNPFSTLEEAQLEVRVRQGWGLSGPTILYLRGGTYHRDSSFILTEEDATEEKPLLIRNYPNEQVFISGGYQLDPANFISVAEARGVNSIKVQQLLDRITPEVTSNIAVYDASGLDFSSYTGLPKEGFGWDPAPASPELIVNGTAQIVARYPNDGFFTVREVVEEGFIPRTNEDPSILRADYQSQTPPTLRFDGVTEDRLARWADESDLWFFGFWRWDWAHDNLPVDRIDIASGSVSFQTPSYYGVIPDTRSYAYNALSELDAPGEWYLDRETQMLFIYSESGNLAPETEIALTLTTEPLFFLDGASGVTVQGLHFNNSRGDGIVLQRASGNTIRDSEFSFLGQKAVVVGNPIGATEGTLLLDGDALGGRNNSIAYNYIHDTGSGGVLLFGGDREQLEPAGHRVENNHFCEFSRLVRTYSPAVSVNGVGHYVGNNEIHNAPHMAIQFTGNDHTIHRNELYDVALETSDVGVIYSARDWTYRGNSITENFIHHIPSLTHGEGSFAIYMDDMMSSAEVRGNIFYNLGNFAFLMGGGRDHRIEENLIIESFGSIIIDARATNWAAASAEAPKGTNYVALQNVPVQSALWSSRYPELITLWDDEPKYPKGNSVLNNISVSTGGMKLDKLVTKYGLVEGNKSYRSLSDSGISISSDGYPEWGMDAPFLEYAPCFTDLDMSSIGIQLP